MVRLVLNLSMLGCKPTGLGVYAEHGAQAISSRFNTSIIAGQGFCPEAPVLVKAPSAVAVGGGKMAAFKRQLWMRQVRVPDGSLVYSPTHHGLPCISNQIITIHDLICLRYPSQHWSQYLFFRFGLPRLLRRCRSVFTVSETTRSDIAKTYRFPIEKIHVVPNGVDTSCFSAKLEASTSDPYLLMVGARYPHKNVQEVLKYSELWSSKYRLKVTSCGGLYRTQLERDVERLGLSDRVEFLDYIDYEHLIRLYQECAVLIYPSRWEGFGIPPLEAFACGKPVIASDIPVHREVLDQAALFVELGNPDSWGAAFLAIENSDDGAVRRRNSRNVLEKFTWENSARKMEVALLACAPELEVLKK